jgi:DNA-directed RNA polymerase specialized sigma24 family protein
MSKRATSQLRTTGIQEVLAALSDADLLRLRRFAQLRARSVPSMEWQDLLQEAIARALDGRRLWPASVDFVVFMRQTIRSIANNRMRQEARQGTHVEFEDESSVDGDSHGSTQPERDTANASLLEQIQALFAADPEVLAILSGIANGESPDEIQRRVRITATQYASAQKRIRRGLARAFPDVGTLS